METIARLCAAADIPHIINNAYGVQSAFLCGKVTRACRVGRVDAIIQSSDKNFMVPVGGTVVATTQRHSRIVQLMAQRYPGRASVSAHLDLMLTLLHLGRVGWRAALEGREALFGYLQVRSAVFLECLVLSTWLK